MNDTPQSSPAANAVKHGFTASKILSAETLALSEAIQVNLTQTHAPQSPEEIEAISELALAKAQQFEVERALRLKIEAEKANAALTYDRAAADAYDKDVEAWKADPANRRAILGATCQGAARFADLWGKLIEDLAPDGGGVPFERACEAAMAMGSPWQVDRIGGDGQWIMARYVRIAPDPDAAMELWAKESNARDGLAFTLNRARKLAAQPTDAVVAHCELVRLATREYDRWTLRSNELRTKYETDRAAAHESAIGTGSGDKSLEREFRLLNRYAAGARNRADRLQRRLDTLKKGRLLAAHRAQQAADREARHRQRESRDQIDTYAEETKRIERERAAYYGESSDPVYAMPDRHSLMRDAFDDCERIAIDSKLAAQMTQLSSDQKDTAQLRNRDDASETLVSEESEVTSQVQSSDSIDEPMSERQDSGGDCDAGVTHDDSDTYGLFAAHESGSPGSDLLNRELSRMPFLDWGDPDAVSADDAKVLKELVAMPDSLHREAIVRGVFGSEATLRRAWRRYRRWASASLRDERSSDCG
jgi:hypothetical protein